MIWSDTTNKTGIVQDCDWWAGTNSDTYPLLDKARNANEALRHIGSLILRNAYGEGFVDDNDSDFYITYVDLVSGNDNVKMDLDVFVLERVRVKDTNGTWMTLKQVSRRELDDTDLNATGTPSAYFRAGQSILFAPAPNYGVIGGIELEYQKSLSQEFTATGNDDRVPGFHADYHRLVALYMAKDYTALHDRTRYDVIVAEIADREAKMERDFQRRNRTKPTSVTYKRRTEHIML